MAAAYTDWLIAANGIASDLATSRSGILLLVLLLLLILQGSRADVTPALGEEPAENAARAGGPGDGRCTPILLGAELWWYILWRRNLNGLGSFFFLILLITGLFFSSLLCFSVFLS